MYSLLNPKLVLFIEKLLVKWSNDKTLDWTIGSIIATLINREYNVNYFVQRYFGVKCNESTVNHNPLYKFLITLNENDIVKYKTIDTGYADTILNRGCKYAVHKEYNNLFEANVPSRETLREIYYYHWLYYCLDTPIWRQRIFTYKGRLNHDLKKVEFDDEDNLQGFYDKWGYYPDEQPVAVGKNVFGCSIDDRQLNVMEFCTRYNATPIMKKVKTGDRHLGTTQNDDDIDMPLTNSIRFKS
jgi:hypothetical protein